MRKPVVPKKTGFVTASYDGKNAKGNKHLAENAHWASAAKSRRISSSTSSGVLTV